MLLVEGRQGIRLVDPDSAAPAGDLRVVDTSGETIELSDYLGQVVMVNAWASWCPPCRVEQPRLTAVEAEFRDEGLVVLGMNVEGLGPADLEQVARDWEIRYPVVVPTRNMDGTPFDYTNGIPHTWLVDRAGRIRASKIGVVSGRSLRRAVQRLLDEPSGAVATSSGL
jgi:thiol-disulfide isomerase/thioredoxin